MSTDDTRHVTPGGYQAVNHDDPDPTATVDLATFQPADPTRFALRVDIWTDEDAFSAFVCSPLWLVESFNPRPESWPAPGPGPTPGGFPPMWSDSGSVMFGRGVMFMRTWNFAQFEAAVREVFADNGGATTGAAAYAVDRVLPWEFADQPERRR